MSIQLRLKELEVPEPREKSASAALDPRSPAFDVSKHIKLVPPFQEMEVDKYFLLFKKIATSLEWPKEAWTLLLQSVLVGKAHEIYSAMLIEQSSQYEVVKKRILKAYELQRHTDRTFGVIVSKRSKHTQNSLRRRKCYLTDGTLQKK